MFNKGTFIFYLLLTYIPLIIFELEILINLNYLEIPFKISDLVSLFFIIFVFVDLGYKRIFQQIIQKIPFIIFFLIIVLFLIFLFNSFSLINRLIIFHHISYLKVIFFCLIFSTFINHSYKEFKYFIINKLFIILIFSFSFPIIIKNYYLFEDRIYYFSVLIILYFLYFTITKFSFKDCLLILISTISILLQEKRTIMIGFLLINFFLYRKFIFYFVKNYFYLFLLIFLLSLFSQYNQIQKTFFYGIYGDKYHGVVNLEYERDYIFSGIPSYCRDNLSLFRIKNYKYMQLQIDPSITMRICKVIDSINGYRILFNKLDENDKHVITVENISSGFIGYGFKSSFYKYNYISDTFYTAILLDFGVIGFVLLLISIILSIYYLRRKSSSLSLFIIFLIMSLVSLPFYYYQVLEIFLFAIILLNNEFLRNNIQNNNINSINEHKGIK